MAQNRTVPTLVAVLLVCAGLLGWLFYPTAATPGVTPMAAPGVAADGVEPAAAMSTQAQVGDKALAATEGGARTELVGGTTAAGRYRLSGRAVGLDGAPMAGVDLAFAQLPASGGDVPVDLVLEVETADAARAQTGADGRFSLLLPAAIEHVMSLPEQPVYLKQVDHGRNGLRVAGLSADRDLGDIAVGRTGRLAGRVEDELTGRPCAGVRVNLGGGLAMMMRGGAPATDAEGRFDFANLRPGEHTLTTASPDYLPARVKVEVGEGQVIDDFRVRLGSGGSIAGVVLDDTGKPVAGLKVGAERARTMGAGVDVRSTNTAEATVTDVAGRFVLRGIDPGAVNVSAWGKGHSTARMDGVAVGTADVVLTARRLGRITGVVVDGTGAPVAGSAVDARSEGGGGIADLRRFGGRSDAKTDAKGEFVVEDVAPGQCAVVVTGEHRRAEVGDLSLAPGATLAGVRVVVQRGATAVVTVVDGAGQPVEGAKVEIHKESEANGGGGWQQARTVSRRVRAGGGGVVIDDGGPSGSATTDAQGVARIVGLEAGRAQARVRHPKFFPAQSPELSVPEVGEVETKVAVAPGGHVAVSAVDLAGAPVADASFKLVGPQEAGSGAKTETGRCDATGVATVGPLEPGTYRACLVLPANPMQLGDGATMVSFDAEGRDLDASAASVTLVAEKTAAVSLVRPVLATFRGVVRDAKGTVAGARVQLTEEGGMDLGMFTSGPKTTTDADGRFELKDLPSGAYEVRFGHPDALVMSEAELTVASGQALVERDLFLSTGTVRLIVRGDDGVPVARAQVTLERAGRAQAAPRARPQRAVMIMATSTGSDEGTTTTSISSGTPSVATDIEGVAELVRVPEGEYTIRIEHPKHAVLRHPDVKVLDGANLDLGTLVMAPGGSFVGQVLSAEGQPVDMAMLELTLLPAGEPRVETAMRGAIRVNGLAAGRYRLRARALTGAPTADWGAPVEVDLGKGERKTVDLRAQ